MKTARIEHGISNARAWLDNIREMIVALDHGGDVDGETLTADEVRERIEESVLSVEVRSAWYTLDRDSDRAPAEFRIVLTIGGPGLQITGSLDEHGEPESPRLMWSDWGQEWTERGLYDIAAPDWAEQAEKGREILRRFCACFYFGE